MSAINAQDFFPTGEFRDRSAQLGVQGDLTIDTGAVLTEDQTEIMNESVKAQKELNKKSFDLGDAFGQLINQTLASSASVEDLTKNLIGAGSQFVNQALQSAVPGFGGQLLGGLGAFFINTLGFEKPPIEDDAIRTKIINAREVAIELSAVRDRSEIAFSRTWQQSWVQAANTI